MFDFIPISLVQIIPLWVRIRLTLVIIAIVIVITHFGEFVSIQV